MVSGKTRRIGRCHGGSYSSNNSSQSSDEEPDQNAQQDETILETSDRNASNRNVSNSDSCLLDNWDKCFNEIGTVINNGANAYHFNDHRKYNIEKVPREFKGQDANLSCAQDLSEIDNCEQTSVDGR